MKQNPVGRRATLTVFVLGLSCGAACSIIVNTRGFDTAPRAGDAVGEDAPAEGLASEPLVGDATITSFVISDTDAGDASVGADADKESGAPVSMASISCGAATCTNGDVCCLTTPTVLTCAASCSGTDLTIRCDDYTDCLPNEVCCAFGWANGPPSGVSCTTSPCEGSTDARRCIIGQPGTCGATSACKSDITSTGFQFTDCQ